uniref:Ovochymase 1 n=1 Tax=Labrus bergylta TaxID=56723 RepID=A0A3Q3FFL3_9LABR
MFKHDDHLGFKNTSVFLSVSFLCKPQLLGYDVTNITATKTGLFVYVTYFRWIRPKNHFFTVIITDELSIIDPLEQEAEIRIIGGDEAWAHSWPWQVSLTFSSMPACGGAIIGPLWVVSAAHCFKRYNKAAFWTVLAGKHDLDNREEPGQQMVGVAMIISHHGYNPKTKECDLALVKLQQPLVFNSLVRPIDVWNSPLTPNRKCTITGWGSTRENGPRVNRLQEVNVTILPTDVCNRLYLGRMKPTMFCAGKEGGGADACQGDSGGPLSCFTGSKYELAGLVSWGVGCGRARKPGVYTKVQQHTDWMFEDMCGQQQRSSSCQRAPGLAALLTSKSGELSVGNVSESCPFSWPWQVSLQSAGNHYCSGVLIHHRWVLTAKHCNVRAKEDVAVLGVHDLRFSSQSVPVEKVFDMKEDGSFPPKSDLSLLRLSVPARFSSSVSPLCVPDEDEVLDSSWSCVTTCWGSTKATGGPHTCLSLGTSCREKWPGLIGDSHICTHPAGSASCMGDQGAPLVCKKHGAYFLFGMVTWGSRQCDADKPAIFSRVADYHSWITELTEDV